MLERFSLITDWALSCKWARWALLAAFLGAANPALATNDCNRLAIRLLKQYSPSGFDTYRLVLDKPFFESYSDKCDDRDDFLDADLITAVHETVHKIREEKEVYHLVSNKLLPVPSAPDYFAPDLVVPILAQDAGIKDDIFFQTYLDNSDPEAPSSRDDFTYLLDEMNAYTHGLRTQIDLAPSHPLVNRDAGVPALMTFVAAYVSSARTLAPAVYRDLIATPVSSTRRAVAILWTEAEETLRQACLAAPTSPHDGSMYMRYLCTDSNLVGISSVLGRPARCPQECAADLDGPE